MQIRRSRWLLAGALLVALVIGACTPGGGGNPTSQPAASPAPAIDY